jgi:Dynamin GTPase effector domain
VDYVPLIVDTELVQGVCQDLAKVLRRSLRLSEPNLTERCREFLREPDEVQEDRERLKQKLHRLARAKEELTDFWSP